jgi:hypothetical protein
MPATSTHQGVQIDSCGEGEIDGATPLAPTISPLTRLIRICLDAEPKERRRAVHDQSGPQTA